MENQAVQMIKAKMNHVVVFIQTDSHMQLVRFKILTAIGHYDDEKVIFSVFLATYFDANLILCDKSNILPVQKIPKMEFTKNTNGLKRGIGLCLHVTGCKYNHFRLGQGRECCNDKTYNTHHMECCRGNELVPIGSC